MAFHLMVNATLIEGSRESGGPTVYQQQVNVIHGLPLLAVLEWGFIYLPIIFHAVYGVYVAVSGQPNLSKYYYSRNIYYVLQRASAYLLIAFILFHVLSLKYGVFGGALAFDPNRATETVQDHMRYSPLIGWLVYPLGLLASSYHLANGVWTAAITWGLTITDRAQRQFGVVCAGIFVLTFGFGMMALIGTAIH